MSDPIFQGGMTSPTLTDVSSVITDRFGLTTASATFKVKNLSGDLSLWVDYKPSWPNGLSWLTPERTIVNLHAGFIEIVVEYVGIPQDSTPVIDFVDTAAEQPIATHPKFDTFAGTVDAPLNNAYFDPDTGEFRFFGSGTKFTGVSTYLDGQVTRRATVCSTTNPSFLRSSVCTLNQISYAGVGPEAGEMFVGYTAEQRGNIFRVELSFRAAGKKGWITEIYQDPNS